MANKKNIGIATAKAVADNASTINSMGKMVENLSNLNTMRGGVKGFKGFVAEEMEAARRTAAGKTTSVINNNGPADLITTGKNGHKYFKQVKSGYKPGQIDFPKYKGQEVIIDKGNPHFKELAKEARKHGVKLTEGTVSNAESKAVADAMQLETKITGAKKATFVPRAAAAHEAGLSAGKTGAMYGAGFSLGSNLVDVARGKKDIGDAAVAVAKDTAISAGAGYVAGAAGSAIAGTSAGASAIAAAGSVGSAVAGTTVGGAVVGAAGAATTAVAGAATAGTAAAIGAAGTAATAVGSAAVAATAGTVVGGAVATGVATATAVGAATAAAAVAAAPVVAVGAAVGVGYKVLKSIFSRD